MGMSYELADAHVADMRDAVWTADAGDVYGRGHSAARKGGVPGDFVSREPESEHRQCASRRQRSEACLMDDGKMEEGNGR